MKPAQPYASSLAIFGYLTRAKEIVTVDLQLTRFIREWEY